MTLSESSPATNINIRIRTRQKDLIDRAAERLGRSRSEFMLSASCREAEEVLCDQVFFQLDAEAFDRFNALMTNPPEPNEGLRRLMSMTPVWN